MVYRSKWVASIAVAACLGASAHADQQELVTGLTITPPAGVSQNVGSLPMNIALSPDGKWAVTTDMGFRESLWSIGTVDGHGVSHLDFPRNNDRNGLYYGLAVSSDGTVYAAQGGFDKIAVATLSADGKLTASDPIATKSGDFPAGLALDGRGDLYVTNNDSANFSAPSSFSIYNTKTRAEVGRYTFASSPGGTPTFPLGIAVFKSGAKTFVASQRDGDVCAFDTSDQSLPLLIARIPTGQHPIGMSLSPGEDKLYVANAQSDTISVIDTAKNVVLKSIPLDPDQMRTPVTSTPTGIALSADGSTLYAALGDMNAVAVVDTVKGVVEGYVPAGWYPSAIAVAGKKLMIVNAKGTESQHANPTHVGHDKDHYSLNVIEGNVLTIDLPDTKQLALDTAQVMKNNRLVAGKPVSPRSKDFFKGLDLPPGFIDHVIYVIKENRTYDQVLGDLPDGAGEPDLAIFGKQVTPNQHALAERFLLLDNFYDCGEASGDGWPWSTGGMANEYVIKNLPYNYSGRGRSYDFEGQNNDYLTGGFPATDPNGNQISEKYPNGAPSIPDIAEPAGHHLWDVCLAAKTPFRNYGFFYSFGSGKDIPDNYPSASGLQPPGHDLDGLSDYDYRRFDTDYPDSSAPELAFQHTNDKNCLYPTTTYGRHNAGNRIAEWRDEFLKMLADDPFGTSVPALMMIRLPSDHTEGLRPGAHSPRAYVADNDYAVGELVEAVSESYIWNSTVIFVIEDDAQDGPDHIDCHRSTCYVISPLIKQHTIDHRFYNTDSVLHTIEGFLSLPSMNAYDANAPVIDDFIGEPINTASYKAILEDDSIMAERNPSTTSLRPGTTPYKLARLAEKMDFIHPDSAPSQLVNEMLWESVKGPSSKMPAAVHKKGLVVQKLDHNNDDGDSDNDGD